MVEEKCSLKEKVSRTDGVIQIGPVPDVTPKEIETRLAQVGARLTNEYGETSRFGFEEARGGVLILMGPGVFGYLLGPDGTDAGEEVLLDAAKILGDNAVTVNIFGSYPSREGNAIVTRLMTWVEHGEPRYSLLRKIEFDNSPGKTLRQAPPGPVAINAPTPPRAFPMKRKAASE